MILDWLFGKKKVEDTILEYQSGRLTEIDIKTRPLITENDYRMAVIIDDMIADGYTIKSAHQTVLGCET